MIAILDAGGQYCHLIARKVRELGVYAEVFPSEVPAQQLRDVEGIIISGGPASVYDPDSPRVDEAIFALQKPVFGICYGQQVMAHVLGGKVTPGDKGEYGMAEFETAGDHPLFESATGRQRIWMSHRDVVSSVPQGFEVAGSTSTCSIAAISDRVRNLFGVQFHPEVVHTQHGKQILSNFVLNVCKAERSWDPKHRVAELEDEIRRLTGDRNIFFFVSGGVDSTVAYTLCLRALGDARVHGTYVDTGLMREAETEFVASLFRSLGAEHFRVEDASGEFLTALAGVRDPEKKRHIIGEQFVAVQNRILRSEHYLEGNWILGQGTIYPDTIESKGTAKADLIKTHHNRVAGIQELIDAGRIIEPLTQFYKDEVREIGRELGLPEEFLNRHPFPGPGLAIRCLCAEADLPVEHRSAGWLIPVRSVGVQGDSRTYKPILSIDGERLHERATELTNSMQEINRVVGLIAGHVPVSEMRVLHSSIDSERLRRLRQADAIVRRLSEKSGFETRVWQFPVVVIPLGSVDRPDSIVLRPIDSVDGMTAQSVEIPADLLRQMSEEILSLEGVCGLFLDLTHKPPGTIEWE